jgi:hypothetical protein
MAKSFVVVGLGLAAGLVVLGGCSSNKPALYDHENFDDAGTYSRHYPVTEKASCEAARRALLSQGYIITSTDPKLVAGHKSFQQTGETHMEISFNIVCTGDGGSDHSSTVFANALMDRYALKKTNNSASLGVGVLGSVSMPIGSSDDSMVKVASETVASDTFYDRYFALVENFLPAQAKKLPAVPVVKPGNELGMPDPAPVAPASAAPAALQPAATVPAQVPVAAPTASGSGMDLPDQSQPVAPPADAAPIQPVPALASPIPTEASPLQAPSESIETSPASAPAGATDAGPASPGADPASQVAPSEVTAPPP